MHASRSRIRPCPHGKTAWIGLTLTATLALAPLTTHADEKPAATIELSTATPGSSLGGEFVEGKMRFRGDDYLVTLHGVAESTSAKVEVYHLLRAKEISGDFKPSDVKGELRNAHGVTLRFDPPLALESDHLEIELSHRNTPKISHGHRESGVE